MKKLARSLLLVLFSSMVTFNSFAKTENNNSLNSDEALLNLKIDSNFKKSSQKQKISKSKSGKSSAISSDFWALASVLGAGLSCYAIYKVKQNHNNKLNKQKNLNALKVDIPRTHDVHIYNGEIVDTVDEVRQVVGGLWSKLINNKNARYTQGFLYLTVHFLELTMEPSKKWTTLNEEELSTIEKLLIKISDLFGKQENFDNFTKKMTKLGNKMSKDELAVAKKIFESKVKDCFTLEKYFNIFMVKLIITGGNFIKDSKLRNQFGKDYLQIVENNESVDEKQDALLSLALKFFLDENVMKYID